MSFDEFAEHRQALEYLGYEEDEAYDSLESSGDAVNSIHVLMFCGDFTIDRLYALSASAQTLNYCRTHFFVLVVCFALWFDCFVLTSFMLVHRKE